MTLDRGGLSLSLMLLLMGAVEDTNGVEKEKDHFEVGRIDLRGTRGETRSSKPLSDIAG